MVRLHNKGITTDLSESSQEKIRNSDSLASNWMIKCIQKQSSDIYLNRQSSSTQNILDYYNGQELHMPTDICPARFKTELDFWGIPEDNIKECCYKKYFSYFQELDLLKVLDDGEKTRYDKRNRVMVYGQGIGFRAVQAKIFTILEYPDSSVLAKLYLYTSNLLVLLSLFVLISKTHPAFQRKLKTDEWLDFFTDEEEERFAKHFDDLFYDTGNRTSNSSFYHLDKLFDGVSVQMDFLTYLEKILVGYFTLELICRVMFFPLKIIEFFTFFNVMDTLAVVVMYASLIANEANNKEKYQESFHDAVHALQVVRCFRLFRLVRHIDGFRIMVYTMKASMLELCTVLLGVFITVTFFASLAYFSTDEAFKTIPDAMWWAIITITTVGYGDFYPKSFQGKLVASACAISGICLLAILIPILVNNFVLFSSQYCVVEKKYKNKACAVPVKLTSSVTPDKSHKF